jgi:hypothetical protein
VSQGVLHFFSIATDLKIKKLIDTGFRSCSSMDLEMKFRTVSKDIGWFYGLDPWSINWHKNISTTGCVQEQ